MLFLRTFLQGQESRYEPGCQAANMPGKRAANLYFSHIIPGTRQLCGRIIKSYQTVTMQNTAYLLNVAKMV